MSMLDRLIAQLKHRGISVEYVGEDQLKLTGNTKQATPDIVAAVKAFKGEFLERIRPRDMSLPRHEVHHKPPPAELENQQQCRECSSFVWDTEETATLCDVTRCPYKAKR